MPADLHCRTWASTSSWDTIGLNDGLTLESGFTHAISYISKAVKFGKNMESWGINHSGALLKKSNFLIYQKSTTAVTFLLTTWEEQQHHHQSAATTSCTLGSLLQGSVTPFPSLPAKLMKNPAASAAGGLVLAETRSLLHCRIGVKSSIVLCI